MGEVPSKYDMNAELKRLPGLEEAQKPMERSKAGAVGLRQFMLHTGK